LGSFYIFWLGTKLFFATEANFSLHRIKNQVGRVFDIEFSNSGRRDGPLTVGGGRADVAKFTTGKERRRELSTLQVRSKIFFKNPRHRSR
jgi:hypothetical protein